MMPDCNDKAENELVQMAWRIASTYNDMAEMIRLGAYRQGSDREVDQAIQLNPKIEDFIRQSIDEHISLEDSYDGLAKAMGLENSRNLLGGREPPPMKGTK